MSFQVMKKNEAPETGYSPYGKPHETFDAAVAKATEAASDKKVPGNTFLVESDNGRDVVSVTYVPGDVLGVDENDNVTRAAGKLVITTDTRYADSKIDSNGNVVVSEEKGKLTVEEVKV